MKKLHLCITASLCLLSIVSTASLTSCTSTYHQESTGQYVDSSAVTVKVKSKLLADNALKNLPITVKTYKNVVQLSGFVDSQAQKVRAIEIARRVPGVVAVKDSLIVK